MSWRVSVLNETVEKELSALPIDMRAKLVRIVELIEGLGLDEVREPYVKHLQKSLWERCACPVAMAFPAPSMSRPPEDAS